MENFPIIFSCCYWLCQRGIFQFDTHIWMIRPVNFPSKDRKDAVCKGKIDGLVFSANVDILSLDDHLPPASSSVPPWSPTTSSSGTSPGFSSPPSTTTFTSGAQGGWWKWKKEFRQNLHLQLTQYLLEIKWSPHAGSHSSQTFHEIARIDYQLVVLHA